MKPTQCLGLFVLLAAWQAHLSGAQPVAPQLWIARFSTQRPGPVASPFKLRRLPRVERETRYRLVSSDSGTVLRAESDSSASVLFRTVEVDPRKFPVLEWSWRIEEPVDSAWLGEKKRDDFAARIFVIFKRKTSPWSLFAGLIGKGAGVMPGRSLNYVWTSTQDQVVVPSPYSRDVAMFAIHQDPREIGSWAVERRNVLQDYRRFYGSEPPDIVGFAIMTDSDNTGQQARACYGDVRFLPADAGRVVSPLGAAVP